MQLDSQTCEILLNIEALRVKQVELGTKEIHINCWVDKQKGQECPNCGQPVQAKRAKYPACATYAVLLCNLLLVRIYNPSSTF